MASPLGQETWLWKVVLIVALLAIVGAALFMSEAGAVKAMQQQHDLNQTLIGAPATQQAELRAENWMVDLVGKHTDLFRQIASSSQSKAPVSSSTPGAKLIDKADTWVGERASVLLLQLMSVMIRFSVSLLWWPFLLIATVPFVIDAVVLRRARAANFGLASPHTYVLGRYVIMLMPLAYLVIVLVQMPIPIPPVIFPIMGTLWAWALWASITNFAKRA